MTMMQSQSSSRSSGAGGGIGMSRAAKKRAKSKKRKESTSQTITAETDETTATVATETPTNKKKKISLLPLDNTTNNNDVDLASDWYDEKDGEKKMQNNDNSDDNNNANDDEEGGLLELQDMELLLSTTLTPRQILLLDDDTTAVFANGGDDGDDDGNRGIEIVERRKEEKDEEQKIVIDSSSNTRRKNHPTTTQRISSEIKNITTTQHRARILLASILSPSGVTVNEFYNNFWGQKPLLVTYHHHHHSKKLNENSTSSHFPQADNDDDDGGNDDDDDHHIKSNNKGQNKEKKKKILNKEQSKTTRDRGGGGGTVISQLTQQQHTTRLDGFLTRSIINDMMSKNKLRYGLDLNVTRYTDTGGGGKDGQFGRQRITLDPLPKKRQKKKKKKSLLLSSNNSNGEEDDNVNDNHDDESDDVEYIIANPTDVWTNVDTASCTLRLLRPHEHNDNIHTLLSLLEVEFGCMVGSNAYLTPLHSQGFAPHYDDVDVFICQLEGYKRWRVYSPMSKRETLPRVSSRDYTEKEMNNDDMEFVLDVILGPGDVLYMPRGWIHQAETVSTPTTTSTTSSSLKPLLSDKHSLHLTISAMQNWCWADYLEILMPVALESAIVSDKSTSLREGLPRGFLHYMGTMHQMDDDEDDTTLLPEGLRQAAMAQQDRAMVAQSHHDDGDDDDDDEQTDYDKKVEEARLIAHERQRQLQQQRQFKEEAKKRIMRVCKQAMSMLDDACDEIGKRFLSDRLPPALLRTEACLTKEGGGSNEDSSSSLHQHHHHHDITKKIWPNTLCRIVRPDIARLVVEDSKAVLYHCLDNSRVYHGTPLSPMEFEIDDAPALEQLLTTVEPHWIMVKDLIHGDVEDKIEIAQTLYDEGILATMLVELPDRSVKTG